MRMPKPVWLCFDGVCCFGMCIQCIFINTVFMPPRSKIGGHIVFVLSVILSFCHSVILSFCNSVILSFCHFVLLSETLTLLITFEQWVLELWYFTWVFLVMRPLFFTLWPWPWSLTNFCLANNFWTVSAGALIFNMSIPCDETFLWMPLFLSLWPWPWSLTHFLKTLTLLITSEQWVLELWYFKWVFFVMRPFRGYHYFLPCDLDLGVWPIFWKL